MKNGHTGFPTTQTMETADQQTDLATPQHLEAEIKNDCKRSNSWTPEDVVSTLSVKSEPDFSPYVCTQKLFLERDSCSPDHLYTEHELFDLKSEVKSEVDSDEQMSLELAERIVNPFQDCMTSKVEVDETDEVCDYNADHSVALLNVCQEGSVQEAQGGNHDTEVLTLTESEESIQEGRVCHVVRYKRKAKPGAREADKPKTQSESLREHLCLLCGKSYSSADTLKAHMKIHNSEKSFICPTCGKAFKKSDYMRKHIRVHTGEKPYVCHLCGKAFPRSDSLADHMRIHNGKKKEKRKRMHSCEVCGKSFTKPCMLLWHQQRHTEHRPFICKQCHKGFKVLTDLRDHQTRSHTDVKPHVCKNCGHCFSRKYCLEKHQRIHTRQKPYSCPHCPKAYSYRQSLVHHLKCHAN
ncbi:zinc finger protein 583-like [Alosa sapidissima]|uniref:zinc finger protein 583-like n=1 Tax=Alosa sapidissima TaxID=34773 RepID=UPI001C0A1815|nr:zinc finger protein 583-like [Alosa sapidissima]